MTESSEVYCINHPLKTTALRCNRCGQPICAACAVRTPVGYRCKHCVRNQQKIFETARWFDYPVAFFVAAFLSGIGSLLTVWVGWIGFFLALAAGALIARVVQWIVRYRRGKYLRLSAVAGAVAGALPLLVGELVLGVIGMWMSGSPDLLLDFLLSVAWPLLYGVVVASTVAGYLKGIQL